MLRAVLTVNLSMIRHVLANQTSLYMVDNTFNVRRFCCFKFSNVFQTLLPPKQARQSLNGQLNGVNSFEPVIVNIRDVNDNAPTFGQSSYAAYASEGLTNGATIAGLSILVYDNDLVRMRMLLNLLGGEGVWLEEKI